MNNIAFRSGDDAYMPSLMPHQSIEMNKSQTRYPIRYGDMAGMVLDWQDKIRRNKRLSRYHKAAMDYYRRNRSLYKGRYNNQLSYEFHYFLDVMRVSATHPAHPLWQDKQKLINDKIMAADPSDKRNIFLKTQMHAHMHAMTARSKHTSPEPCATFHVLEKFVNTLIYDSMACKARLKQAFSKKLPEPV